MPKRSNKNDIAIVGLSCRFPGSANSTEQFWKILSEGRDVVSEVDDSRWSKEHYYHGDLGQAGRTYTWSAGVLSDIDKFDAGFFSISPREAAQMDPQQRLLLEMVWEALEDGSQVPGSLAETNCGVYIGISGTDYANSRIDDPASGDAYTMTGGTLSIAANRISYQFNLNGPSMAIDTACSSSLVAMHQACQSIWNGETESAITGGINLLLIPFNFIGFSRASMLSPRGRCRAFDASGDGYVRAEGGAVLFLKPLSKAKADGDPIRAVITASGVNSDGRTKGLSMPSSEAQERLLRQVYSRPDLDPRELVYLEAHGTGTAAGDPQEAGAIGRALGQARAASDPLPIGSVKTNVGHLEPASGMAGVVKSILTLEHGCIPKTLHFEEPNPNIPFDELNLRVVDQSQDLDEEGKEHGLIGVNSFGFGGTNAHVVLKAYSGSRTKGRTNRAGGASRSRRKPAPLLLSARSEEALVELARSHAALLSGENAVNPYALAYNAAFRREHHPHRLTTFGTNATQIAEGLTAFAAGETTTAVIATKTLPTEKDSPVAVALLFSGNGSQWPGMAQSLLKTDRRFKGTVAEFDDLFTPLAGFSIMERLLANADSAGFERTEVAQPALFAVQAGLLTSMKARGLIPGFVMGHSVGEVSAAYASGAFDLEQSTRLIFERSQAQALTRGAGRMAAAGLSAEEGQAAIEALGVDLEIAAHNSAKSITLSGALDELELLGEYISAQEKFFRVLDLDYAFHSEVMDPVKDSLVEALTRHGLKPAACTTPMISTVSGEVLTGEELGPRYWWDNIRQPVRLDLALATLLKLSTPIIVETGPNPIMALYTRDALHVNGKAGAFLSTLRKDGDDDIDVTRAVLGCYANGASLDTKCLFPVKAPLLKLPTYPWQRERYWYEPTNESLSLLGPKYEHPLLGYLLPRAELTWESYLDTTRLPFLADHVVGGATVFPAAGFVEMALAASSALTDGPSHTVEHLEIRSPLLLYPDESRVTQFRIVGPDRSFEIRSRPRLDDQPWSIHVVGRLDGPSSRSRPGSVDVQGSWSKRAEQVSASTHYHRAALVGLDYGPAFQAVSKVFVAVNETRVTLEPPATIAAGIEGYQLHPSLLDGCLQALVDSLAADANAGTTHEDGLGFLPFHVGRLVLHQKLDHQRPNYCRVNVTRKTHRSILADFTLYDETGSAVAEIRDFRFRRMRLGRGGYSGAAAYGFELELAPRTEDQQHGLLPAPGLIAEGLVEDLAEQWYSMRRADHYGQVLPLLDALTAGYAYRAIRALGGSRGEFHVGELMRAAGIPNDNQSWLTWLLGVLEEDRLAEQVDHGWRLIEDDELIEPDEIWRVLLADFPGYLPEISLAGRVGAHLVDFLKGDFDAEAVLANGNQTSAADQLLEFSPALRISECAARDVVASIAKDWPENRRLRLLELSLGSGALSAEIAEVLPEGRGDYVLACKADQAARAKASLTDHPGVEVVEVDLDKELSPQGLSANGFDLVLVTHVLHSVENPRGLLASIRGLMVSDGILIALERPPERLSDLVFGADPHWWGRSNSPHQPLSRLRPSDAWQELMQQTGFSNTVELAEPTPDVSASSYLVLARNPELVDAGTGKPLHRRVLIVSDPGGESHEIAVGLKSALDAAGDGVLLATTGTQFHATTRELELDPLDPTHWQRLFGFLRDAGGSCDEIVHLVGLALDPDTEKGRDPMAGQAQRCMPVVHIGNTLRELGLTELPRIWLVGTGSSAVDDPRAGDPLPSQAPLRGLGRVLENELPDIRWKLLDLATDGNPREAIRLLASELMTPDDEDEVIRTADARYALRATRTGLEPPIERRLPEADQSVRLDFSTPGPLSNLKWRLESPREPGPQEIQIKVQATGLNFRDVMYAMGMLSDEAVENGFAGATLGMECAGDVIAVGSDVTGFEKGDEVVCFARACFATHVTTETTAVAHKPQGWSYAEAATIPSVFFTVYYALHHLAHLEPGERILIHGAAGGVGLAAIQFARYRGAEIFATAGSDEKRDFLKLLGVDHILDSRSLAFADQILDLTGGEGVDVVLNSLSGEAVLKNLAVLKPFGQFLELGKRDFYENAKMGLRPFRNNITYYGIDADQLLVERSALAGSLFREMMEHFKQGAFRPLVHRVFPCARATDAFRHMQQSKHIGKIIITYEDLPRVEMTASPKPDQMRIDPEGCYLISGGFGGFGLATAAWLANKGARHIALAGRRGAADDHAVAAIEAIEAQGTHVHALLVDVSDREALESALEPFGHRLPPIKGVIHAAMVLADGKAQDLTRDKLEQVLKPKVAGAWNLHRATHNLDFFVLYSSATTDFGNPGQANYVAANLYLEALAAYRRQRGQPATSVGWGPIDDVGVLARDEETKANLSTRIGGHALKSREALDWLERLIATDHSGLSVADVDWRILKKTLPAAKLAKYQRLLARGDDADGTAGDDVRALMANLTEGEVNELVTAMLADEIASVMQTSADKLDVTRSVYDLGMDSLMAVELHMALENKFGINLPIMVVTEGGSIAKLGERIAGLIAGSGTVAAEPEHSAVAKLAAQHGEEVTDQEMASLVNDMLKAGGGRLIT